MRVLHLTRDYPPRSAGGISTAVGGLVHASRRAGVDVAVVSFDGYRPAARATTAGAPPRPSREDGVPVLRVSAPSQLDAVRAFAAEVAPDLLHVHHDMLWDVAAPLRDDLGAPIGLSIHVAQKHQSRLRSLDTATASERAQAEAVAGADLVLAPSRAAAAVIAADHPAAAEHLHVAPLGIDLPAAPPPPFDDREHGLVAYAGRFADIKGTGELLAALPRILEAAPAARAVIAGGLPENAKAARRWRRRFEGAHPRLADRVSFPGWLDAAELDTLYRRAAVVVVPSWFETFGLSCAEAMARGAPVVATRAGALPEVTGDAALLVEPRDAGALAAAMLDLLGDRARARSLGARAAAAATQLAWDDAAREMLAAYARIAGDPS